MGSVSGAAQDFIEITVRVPLAGLVDPDWKRQQVVDWVAEEYRTALGLVSDNWEVDGVSHTTKLKWKGEESYVGWISGP